MHLVPASWFAERFRDLKRLRVLPEEECGWQERWGWLDQELVYCGTLVQVFEQTGNRQARTTEAPRPAKLVGVPVDSAAAAPVHIASLSLIGVDRFTHFPN
jgi:hypothetical protein